MKDAFLPAPTRVLTTTEMREQAPAFAQECRTSGLGAGVLYFGAHRRPDAAVVPAELLEALAPYIEDLVIAGRVRERRVEDTGDRLSLAELDTRLGLNPADIDAVTAELRRELDVS